MVPELLERYRSVLEGEQQWQVAQKWLQGVPDSNGNQPGCSQGSLVVRSERSRDSMKPTASMRTT